jgi:D-arginine dehydrogenase
METDHAMNKDFCIIGGGIAGLSIAYHLSQSTDICVLEQESDLAYHTTGRSAALYSELIVEGMVGKLTRLSHDFFAAPPEEFTERPLIDPIGCLFTATASEVEHLQTTFGMSAGESRGLKILDGAEIVNRIPILKTGKNSLQCALYEPIAARIDVGELIAGYRKNTLRNGGEILCGTEVVSISRDRKQWKVCLQNGEVIKANKIINAAGAWGDVIAEMAGAKPVGLTPMRRSMIVFDGPVDIDFTHWPAIGGITGGYYFLPEAGKLVGSSSDEVPSPPCDASPEEYDIALAAHRIEAVTSLNIKRIHHKWAGLRTFTPDRQPLIGYDDACPDFFWAVGQGGAGIQTAPALSKVAASLALNKALNNDLTDAGITADNLGRKRLDR